jgi:flagellar basal-body rod protein FlgB
MLSKLGHKNFSLLGKMLDLTSARHRVIAQNVANVNTPNYRRREFSFASSLNDALQKGHSAAYKGVRGEISRPNTTAVRNNGNNVDIDMETVSLQENSTLYQVYSEFYHQRLGMMKTAIKGGGR